MAEPLRAPDAPVMVSVVVCTYNREKFLPDCLDSLSGQDADPASFEVLVVDNRSTDGTARIAQAWLQEHPRLQARYLYEEEQGLSQARNRGLIEALGEVITYIDDDAVAEPDLVSRIQAFFQRHPEMAGLGGKVLARFEGARPDWYNPYSAPLLFSHYDPADEPFVYRGSRYPIGCNMSLRRSALEGVGGFDTRLGRRGKGGVGAEEKALFEALRRRGQSVAFDPAVVVHHQIDRERTQAPYMRKLALGLGQTHRRMYCDPAMRWPCIRILLVTLFKFQAALILALGYLLRGRPAIARHLVWYRWLVLRGLLI